MRDALCIQEVGPSKSGFKSKWTQVDIVARTYVSAEGDLRFLVFFKCPVRGLEIHITCFCRPYSLGLLVVSGYWFRLRRRLAISQPVVHSFFHSALVMD